MTAVWTPATCSPASPADPAFGSTTRRMACPTPVRGQSRSVRVVPPPPPEAPNAATPAASASSRLLRIPPRTGGLLRPVLSPPGDRAPRPSPPTRRHPLRHRRLSRAGHPPPTARRERGRRHPTSRPERRRRPPMGPIAPVSPDPARGHPRRTKAVTRGRGCRPPMGRMGPVSRDPARGHPRRTKAVSRGHGLPERDSPGSGKRPRAMARGASGVRGHRRGPVHRSPASTGWRSPLSSWALSHC
jgi:hypothetical protein